MSLDKMGVTNQQLPEKSLTNKIDDNKLWNLYSSLRTSSQQRTTLSIATGRQLVSDWTDMLKVWKMPLELKRYCPKVICASHHSNTDVKEQFSITIQYYYM